MVNFINLTNDNDSIFSETINNINTSENIIVSTSTSKHITFDSTRRVTFIATDNIAITQCSTVGEFALFEYKPKVKISHPIGVDMDFKSPYNVYYYNNIYTMNDIYFNESSVLYNRINAIIYVDRAIFKRFKKPLAINKGDKLLSLNFSYNIQINETIKNIYCINDNFVYENFLDHFGGLS